MAPIEYLQQFANADKLNTKEYIYYNDYLYREKVKDEMKDKYGIQTTGLSKPLMVGCLLQFVNEDPKCIKSQDLIDQFSSIEKTSSGTIKSTGYSDLFMAACFCALVRNKMAMEILPLIESKSSKLQGTQFVDNYANVLATVHGSKSQKQSDYSDEEVVYSSSIEALYGHEDMEESETSFIPFFSS